MRSLFYPLSVEIFELSAAVALFEIPVLLRGPSADPAVTPLQEDIHFRVLRILQDNPRITQRELSDRLGVSLGAINFVLKALVGKGAIKIRNFRGNTRKLSYAYVLTPYGLSEKAILTARFLIRKRKEFELLKAEIEAVSQERESDSSLVESNNS